jgi:hypothetical protein
MKILITLLLGMASIASVSAQDSLLIKHNGRVIFNNLSSDDSLRNTFVLDRGDLKDDYLLLTFNPREKPAGWTRTISVNDDRDRVIFQKESNGISIPGVVLKQWSKKLDAIKIYTWSQPNDAKTKSSIRIRRVHLCTLVFK